VVGLKLPVAELNTLADIIAACVNSTGGSAPSGISDGSLCRNLFALTPNSSNGYLTDTVTALLNIARNPSQNVTALK
jgi:hypothetical protein